VRGNARFIAGMWWLRRPGSMRWLLISALLLAPAWGQATEPLRDILHIEGQSGPFAPEECCWVDLPRTERLIAAKRAQRCSAIGGPVGRFQLWEDRIWLIGLYRCGGDMQLDEIYPEMEGPTLASWLNGQFSVRLELMCFTEGAMPVFRTTHSFVVEHGEVVETQTETHDGSDCFPPLT